MTVKSIPYTLYHFLISADFLRFPTTPTLLIFWNQNVLLSQLRWRMKNFSQSPAVKRMNHQPVSLSSLKGLGEGLQKYFSEGGGGGIGVKSGSFVGVEVGVPPPGGGGWGLRYFRIFCKNAKTSGLGKNTGRRRRPAIFFTSGCRRQPSTALKRHWNKSDRRVA